MMVDQIKYTPQDRDHIAHVAYAENAGEDDDTVKMTAASIKNRLEAKRIKEFGKDVKEVTKKGYVAVQKNSPLYQEASSGKFKDTKSKVRYGEVRKLVDIAIDDPESSKAQFYFRPEEEEAQKKIGKNGKPKFDFKQVKPTGRVGVYNTYRYK
jgi:hypothetical protein